MVSYVSIEIDYYIWELSWSWKVCSTSSQWTI